MDKTAVIILHYKNPADTLDCLRSLIDHEFLKDPFQIYVVLNSYERGFSESIKFKFINVKVLENYENGGFAQGNNKGIRRALADVNVYFILLNNDTKASSQAIRKMIKVAQKNETVGLISPKIYFERGYEFHKERYYDNEKGKVIWYGGGKIDWKNIYASHENVDEVDKNQHEEARETDFATGCCMLLKKKTIDKAGFLDEKYFLYFEDVDYSLRVKKTGLEVFYNPNVSIYHKNAGSTGKPGSSLQIYYQTRNRLYFGMKYASLHTKLSLFKESLTFLLKKGLEKQAVLDYYLGRMGKKK